MKRLLCVFLAAALLLSITAVCAVAADAPAIAVENVTAQQQSRVTVGITASCFSAVGSGEFSLHYDPEALTVTNASAGDMIDQSNSMLSVNTDTNGTVRFSAASVSGFAESGTLLWVTFQIADDAESRVYPLELAVGEAWDVSLAELTIGKESGSITVTERVSSAMTFYLYGYYSANTAKKGDEVTLRLRGNYSQYFAAAEFEIRYDDTLLAVDSVELDSGLVNETAQYSINTGIPGAVRITYASADAVRGYNILYVHFKVIGDVSGSTAVSFGVSNAYDEEQQPFAPYSGTASITLEKLTGVTDYPDLWLETEQMTVGKQARAVLKLEKGAKVAAGDFSVSYDPSVLRCISVTAAPGLADIGGMVVVDDNFTDGSIEFPYVNTEGYCEEDVQLVEILWEVLQSSNAHCTAVPAAEMVYDAAFNPLTLECIAETDCIYVNTGAAPQDDPDNTQYSCAGCGSTIVLPRVLTGVTIATLPDKLIYIAKVDALDLTGASVAYCYDNGVQNVQPVTGEMVAGFDSTQLGKQTLSVHCGEIVQTFEITLRKATVVFQNWDGAELSREEYMGGEPVAVPDTPVRPADETYRYTFVGWDKTVVPCDGDAVYKAVFEAEYIPYTVTFKNQDGTVLQEQTYHYGDEVIAPADPTPPAGADQNGVFQGWDREVSTTCTGNAVYTAVFAEPYLRGDMNCDGRVTDADAVYLLRHTLFKDGFPIFQSGDFNNDGKTTDADAVYLLRYTLFPERFPLN